MGPVDYPAELVALYGRFEVELNSWVAWHGWLILQNVRYATQQASILPIDLIFSLFWLVDGRGSIALLVSLQHSLARRRR